MLDPAAYALALITLENGGPVDDLKFDSRTCTAFSKTNLCRGIYEEEIQTHCPPEAGNPYGSGTAVLAAQALVGPIVGFLENEKTFQEPSLQVRFWPVLRDLTDGLLQPYVCLRGFAIDCGQAF